jgi:predicted SprT family Zn-dependent metalloprotease
MNPTQDTYRNLNKAYEFFNKRLFDGMLPRCLVTLQRRAGSYGYFHNQIFSTRDGHTVTDEIALNPKTFKDVNTEHILATLVHEMVHQRQFRFGNPSKAYHNKEWAMMMKQVGLHPSATAQPGGKETGQKCSHYIIRGGKFDVACAALLKSGCDISYVEIGRDEKEAKRKNETKSKYSCPICGLNVWGQADITVLCGECDEPVEMVMS